MLGLSCRCSALRWTLNTPPFRGVSCAKARIGLTTLAAIAADVSSAVRRLISRRVKSIELSKLSIRRGPQRGRLRQLLRWKADLSHFLIGAQFEKNLLRI